MCFAIQKKELINLKNTLGELENNDHSQWIRDFSIVKLVSIWEQIIRNFADISLSKIENDSEIRVTFDKKRFHEFVWKNWLDGNQTNLTNPEIQLQVKDVKRCSKVRNSVAHGNTLQEDEKQIISAIDNTDSLLNKTLEIIKTL